MSYKLLHTFYSYIFSPAPIIFDARWTSIRENPYARTFYEVFSIYKTFYKSQPTEQYLKSELTVNMPYFSGNIRSVTKRLDARYDWLPSPNNLNSAHKRLPLKFVGDACALPSDDLTGSLAVATMSGHSCSCFTKASSSGSWVVYI